MQRLFTSLLKPQLSRRRGGVLLSVLVMVAVVSIVLAGMARFVISHQSLGVSRSNHMAALYLAEAGINYELRKISLDQTQADQKVNGLGVLYNVGSGTVRLHCANKNFTTPWDYGSNLYILATATMAGSSRNVRIAVRPVGSNFGQYVLFGNVSGSSTGSSPTINGDIGTNGPSGTLGATGSPTINGSIVLNGTGSTWTGGGSYTVVNKPNTIPWPTVTSIATTLYGSNAIAWLKTHNDNALANPALPGNYILTKNGNSVQTLVGKAGGANYYLESITFSGNATFSFNNTAGPITIWIGPDGGNGTVTLNGGVAAVKMATDTTKPVKLYSATTGAINANGNNELDAFVYNINATNTGTYNKNGTGLFLGQAIVNRYTVNGAGTFTYQGGYLPPSLPDYYTFDNLWEEF